MPKRLILQTYYRHESNVEDKKTGCYLPVDELAAESIKRFRFYAASIGADYRLIDSPPYKKYPQPAWARWAIFDIAIEENYDEVCYVDADILPSNRSLGVSIFDYPGVAKQTEREDGSRHSWHVNAGVFKVTRQECFKLRTAIHSKPNLRWLMETGKNQDPFNNAYKKGVGKKPEFLDPIWNMTRQYHRKGSVPGGYFAHYIGHQKIPGGNQWGDMTRDPIYLENW